MSLFWNENMQKSHFYCRWQDYDVHAGCLKASCNTSKHNYSISGVQIDKNPPTTKKRRKDWLLKEKMSKKATRNSPQLKLFDIASPDIWKWCSESKKTLYFQCFLFCGKTCFSHLEAVVWCCVVRCSVRTADVPHDAQWAALWFTVFTGEVYEPCKCPDGSLVYNRVIYCMCVCVNIFYSPVLHIFRCFF